MDFLERKKNHSPLKSSVQYSLIMRLWAFQIGKWCQA